MIGHVCLRIDGRVEVHSGDHLCCERVVFDTGSGKKTARYRLCEQRGCAEEPTHVILKTIQALYPRRHDGKRSRGLREWEYPRRLCEQHAKAYANRHGIDFDTSLTKPLQDTADSAEKHAVGSNLAASACIGEHKETGARVSERTDSLQCPECFGAGEVERDGAVDGEHYNYLATCPTCKGTGSVDVSSYPWSPVCSSRGAPRAFDSGLIDDPEPRLNPARPDRWDLAAAAHRMGVLV